MARIHRHAIQLWDLMRVGPSLPFQYLMLQQLGLNKELIKDVHCHACNENKIDSIATRTIMLSMKNTTDSIATHRRNFQ